MMPSKTNTPTFYETAKQAAMQKCGRCYRPYSSDAEECPLCAYVPHPRRCGRCQKPTTERTLCPDCMSWAYRQQAKARIAMAENIGVESKEG